MTHAVLDRGVVERAAAVGTHGGVTQHDAVHHDLAHAARQPSIEDSLAADHHCLVLVPEPGVELHVEPAHAIDTRRARHPGTRNSTAMRVACGPAGSSCVTMSVPVAAAGDRAAVVGETVVVELHVDVEAARRRGAGEGALHAQAVGAPFEEPDVRERLGVQPGQVLPVEHVLAHRGRARHGWCDR